MPVPPNQKLPLAKRFKNFFLNREDAKRTTNNIETSSTTIPQSNQQTPNFKKTPQTTQVQQQFANQPEPAVVPRWIDEFDPFPRKTTLPEKPANALQPLNLKQTQQSTKQPWIDEFDPFPRKTNLPEKPANALQPLNLPQEQQYPQQKPLNLPQAQQSSSIQKIKNFFLDRKDAKIGSTSQSIPIPQRVFGNIDRLRHQQWHNELQIAIDKDGYLLNQKGGQRLALEEQLKRRFEKIDFNNIEITPAKQVQSNIQSNIPQRVFGHIDRLRHEKWKETWGFPIDENGYLLNKKGGQRLALEEQLKRNIYKIDLKNIEITPAKQVQSIPPNDQQLKVNNRKTRSGWGNSRF